MPNRWCILVENTTLFNSLPVRCGTRRLWLAAVGGADNLSGRYPDEHGRYHTAQPSSAGSSETSVAVHDSGGPDYGSCDLWPHLRGRGLFLDHRRSFAARELRGVGPDCGRNTSHPSESDPSAICDPASHVQAPRHRDRRSASAALLSPAEHRDSHRLAIRDRY